MRVEFLVYRALHAQHDPAATGWLRAAHARQQLHAGRLPDGAPRARLLRGARYRAVLEAYAAAAQ